MSALAAPTFSERLRKRYALWWAPPPPWWTLRGARLQLYRRGLSRLHRADEMQVLRHRADPDRVWRFCRYWQRTLLNKFNSREFVQRYDCRVPTLYWCGRRIVDLPVESLSDSYVIRPVIGAASKRVYAVIGDHDLMSETTVTRANLRDRLVSEFGEVAAEPILVEELRASARVQDPRVRGSNRGNHGARARLTEANAAPGGRCGVETLSSRA
jgi:hypothetical protein